MALSIEERDVLVNASMYDILKQFGQVKLNEPLSKHTTFKIGGPADILLTVLTVQDAVKALKYLEGEGIPFFLLGGGSNMLVRDEGFRGVALHIRASEVVITGTSVTADAGAITADVSQQSIKAGLTGFEWGVGVPGTIGGAVRGNAGAVGSEMKEAVSAVEVYQNGEVVTYTNKECEFLYRESIFKHTTGVVLRVTLALEPGSNTEALKKALSYVAFRTKTQPQGFSTGCVFKNASLPETIKFELPDEFRQKGNISAGWLVEHAGGMGMTIGGAEVSTKHGNFIMNKGQGTAQDVLTLIDQVKEKVYDTFGITLEEEVQII